MILEVRTKIKPINILDCYEPIELFDEDRAVYIDGVRCPKELEKIILDGLDVQMLIYVMEIEEDAKKSGIWRQRI